MSLPLVELLCHRHLKTLRGSKEDQGSREEGFSCSQEVGEFRDREERATLSSAQIPLGEVTTCWLCVACPGAQSTHTPQTHTSCLARGKRLLPA